MSQLINLKNELEDEELKGKHIYQTNDHFRRLATVMEHPEFREFYNTYMTDWEDAKTMIMFMKVYEALEKHAKIQLTPYQKLAVLKDMIDNKDKRKLICEGFSEWCNKETELEKKKIEYN
jgi:hypothetical protein